MRRGDGNLSRSRSRYWVGYPTLSQAVRREPDFGYDLRRGAAGFAPIVGTIAGFVVTGVVLVFTIVSHYRSGQPVPNADLLGRASALLVLGLIGCLLSAFALAAIGAERKLTPNLTAATLYVGICTAIGIVAILGAFEVLATIYLPKTQDLFAIVTGGVAVSASVLVALVLGDAWITPGLSQKHWLYGRVRSAWWASGAAAVGALVLGIAIALYFEHVRIGTGEDGLHEVVAVGIFLAFASGVGSMLRTMHGKDGKGRAIQKAEALAALGVMNAYMAMFLLLMP